jgi:CysZ protein
MSQNETPNNTHALSRAPAGFVAGGLYLLQALGMIRRHRTLWPYVMIPIGVNIVVGLVLYTSLAVTGFQAIAGIGGGSGWWESLLVGLLQAFLLVGLALGLGWVLVRFGVVLGSPWYGQLSEQIEQITTGRTPNVTALTWRSVLYDIWRALQFEAKKLGLVLAIGVPLFLIGFFPGFGQIVAGIGGIMLGATIACLDFFDATLERRRLRFRAKLAVLRTTFPASAGFGLPAFGLVSIPLLNLLSIPLCVTAGTMFVLDRAPGALQPDSLPDAANVVE